MLTNKRAKNRNNRKTRVKRKQHSRRKRDVKRLQKGGNNWIYESTDKEFNQFVNLFKEDKYNRISSSKAFKELSLKFHPDRNPGVDDTTIKLLISFKQTIKNDPNLKIIFENESIPVRQLIEYLKQIRQAYFIGQQPQAQPRQEPQPQQQPQPRQQQPRQEQPQQRRPQFFSNSLDRREVIKINEAITIINTKPLEDWEEEDITNLGYALFLIISEEDRDEFYKSISQDALNRNANWLKNNKDQLYNNNKWYLIRLSVFIQEIIPKGDINKFTDWYGEGWERGLASIHLPSEEYEPMDID